MLESVHLNLDGAWDPGVLDLANVDALRWGPALRFTAPEREVEAFYGEVVRGLPPFVLYGSGDFHHLTALFLRQVARKVTVVDFDNHPDWDVRPPRWACGGWVNRALECPLVGRVSVWGLGNFELGFPHRLFGNRRALSAGRLELHPWAERQGGLVRRRFECMTRDSWRERFSTYARSLRGEAVYVTVDMDCLSQGEAATNWESGLFTADDLEWAIRELRGTAAVVGGDVCGAWSPPRYARWTQRLAAGWDHPPVSEPDRARSRQMNLDAVRKIWGALAPLGTPARE